GGGQHPRSQLRYGTNRSALRPLWRASRACISRWTQTHRRTLLHERRRLEIRGKIMTRMLKIFAMALAVAGGAGAAFAQEMPKTLAAAVAMEQADALPIGDFYSPPA